MQHQTSFDSLAQAYALHFAEQPRATRDLSTGEKLLQELQALAEVGNSDAKNLAADLATELEACRGEQQSLGQEGCAKALRAERIASLRHHYHRHFAGMPRQTRDTELLGEIIGSLQALGANVDGLEKEREAIEAAYEAIPCDSKVGVLGAMANGLFAQFEAYLAGLRPVAVRPGLLQRLVRRLGWIEAQLQHLALKQPGNGAQTNLQVVGDQLDTWRELSEQVRIRRSETQEVDLLQALAGELDHALNVASRHDGSREAWAQVSDRTVEIASQLHDLSTNPEAARLERAARDALRLFQRRYDVQQKSA